MSVYRFFGTIRFHSPAPHLIMCFPPAIVFVVQQAVVLFFYTADKLTPSFPSQQYCVWGFYFILNLSLLVNIFTCFIRNIELAHRGAPAVSTMTACQEQRLGYVTSAYDQWCPICHAEHSYHGDGNHGDHPHQVHQTHLVSGTQLSL